jgi:transposase-like protein
MGPRKVSIEDLVGAAEIAGRLGIAQPQTVHSWRRRYEDFPEPIAQLQTALIWAWPDVRAWARRTGRLG